jgi:hypothetical protein
MEKDYTILLNITLSVGISWDERHEAFVVVEATKFNDEHTPISWAIRRSGSVMSKTTGHFDYEPMPSSRDDEFFAEYRFTSMEEAINCWDEHYNKQN